MLLFSASQSLESQAKVDKYTEKNSSQNVSMQPNRLQQIFSRLCIGQKIGYGYALAIGIAILGTGTGMIVGDYFRKQALMQLNVAQQQQELLQNFQNTVLKARSHAARLPAVLGDTVWLQYESDRFFREINDAKNLISEIESFALKNPERLETEATKFQAMLKRYAIILDYYCQLTKLQLQEVEAANLRSEKIAAAQLQMLRISRGEEALLLDNISENLTELITAVQVQKVRGLAELEEAEGLRYRILLGSMLISALIAALLAINTSRAIAQPVESVTNVARQVARESNFNLKVPVTTEDEIGVLATSFNLLIQRVSDYTQELKQTQAQLIQTEKMSSLGQMVAGVAHEINNPVNFIRGNVDYANRYTEDLLQLVNLYQENYPNPAEAIHNHLKEIDMEFLREDLPKTLSSMKMGADRIHEIVVSMRNFSRSDDGKMKPGDIHEGINSTLIILNHRVKQGIQVVKNYGILPLVDCYPAQLNQVFMNVIGNAIDALEEMKKGDKGYAPTIWISTEVGADNTVTVKIRDNGPGIDLDCASHIFDPFFTTKSIGKGTGLGLAISHQIVAKHHGTIEMNSQIGKGTEFAINLPVAA